MKEFFVMNNFINSKFVLEMSEITSNMYRQGWDERNGGNISYLIDEEYVREYFKEDKFIRDINLGFEADPIVRGKYFLVTGNAIELFGEGIISLNNELAVTLETASLQSAVIVSAVSPVSNTLSTA
jgi:hypothetical protein